MLKRPLDAHVLMAIGVEPLRSLLRLCFAGRRLTVVVRGAPLTGVVGRTIGLSSMDVARILFSESISGEQ
jgi:hypothetical protein